MTLASTRCKENRKPLLNQFLNNQDYDMIFPHRWYYDPSIFQRERDFELNGVIPEIFEIPPAIETPLLIENELPSADATLDINGLEFASASLIDFSTTRQLKNQIIGDMYKLLSIIWCHGHQSNTYILLIKDTSGIIWKFYRPPFQTYFLWGIESRFNPAIHSWLPGDQMRTPIINGDGSAGIKYVLVGRGNYQINNFGALYHNIWDVIFY